jgi:hypothetical protein
MISLKYKETNLFIMQDFKTSELAGLFTEKNVVFTNQLITNYTLIMSINVMTLGIDS